MDGFYGEWYDDFKEAVETLGDDELFDQLDSLLRSSRSTFAFNRKLMEKAIDVSWVEAIENGLIHVDNVLRNPSRTIEDVEEIVPIERSRKITVESVKHLAQHTDFIQSIDKRTGKITPSKILNVHKEESFMTYENKFVNTLIDRLYIFITTRYEKLAQVAHDEEVFTMGYDTSIDNGSGGKMKIELKIETSDSLETADESGVTIWQRVEKLKKAIEGYKGSELCMTLGNTFIKPPVMRTNAIMKNVELKACLTLWQYIEGYDKVGYEINIENTAVKPQNSYVEDFYKLVAMNLLLFRSYTQDGEKKKLTDLKTVKQKAIAPKFLKHFDKEIAADYGVQSDAAVGYIAADGDFKVQKRLPKNMNLVYTQINEAIRIEKAYLAEREKQRAAQAAAEVEAERLRQEEEARQEELRRIEEAKREERERAEREKAEEEKRIAELLEQKRREQEEEQRERERLEAERLARLEEQRKREEEERIRREEEERAAAERERIAQNKHNVRSELGEAEGVDADKIGHELSEEELEKQAYQEVTKEEIEEAKAELEEKAEEEQQPEFEDPRAVAARKKLEQQRLEKERREAERAQRLKEERTYFENKPFEEIRREYSKNPLWVFARLIRYIMVYWFHIIPKDTDNPDFKKLRAELEEKKRIREKEAAERDAMEVYYRKYAMTFKYRFRRYLSDRKFKKKRRLEARNKPKPVYNPPKRTPEEQKAIDLEMKRLYKEYHVSLFERLVRNHKERVRMRHEINESVSQKKNDSKVRRRLNRVIDIAVTILLVASFILCGYVLINTARGKPVNIFGRCVLKVVTGSMEPSIRTDDFIIVEKTDTAELSVGDIISFYSDQEDIKGKLVTHRIVGINDDGSFETKGDANLISDRVTANPDKIVGKYTGKARFFIWVSSFASPRKLLMILIIIPVAIAAIFEIRSVTKIGKQLREEKRKQAEESKQRLIRQEIEKEKQRLEREGYMRDEVEKDESR